MNASKLVERLSGTTCIARSVAAPNFQLHYIALPVVKRLRLYGEILSIRNIKKVLYNNHYVWVMTKKDKYKN